MERHNVKTWRNEISARLSDVLEMINKNLEEFSKSEDFGLI